MPVSDRPTDWAAITLPARWPAPRGLVSAGKTRLETAAVPDGNGTAVESVIRLRAGPIQERNPKISNSQRVLGAANDVAYNDGRHDGCSSIIGTSVGQSASIASCRSRAAGINSLLSVGAMSLAPRHHRRIYQYVAELTTVI